MIKTYQVCVDYERPKSGPTSVYYFIQAVNAGLARQAVIKRLRDDKTRKVRLITGSTAKYFDTQLKTAEASVGGPEVPNLQQISKFQTGTSVIFPDGKKEEIKAMLKSKAGVEYVVLEDSTGTPTISSLVGLKNRLVPPTKTSVWSIYPSDTAYKSEFNQPVKTSSFDLNDLVQIKIVRTLDGKLVSKEFV